MDINFPLQFDGRGRTSETTPNEHIRDLIEQVLFTAPGERLNRPGFGSGIMALVFEPNSEVLAAASQLMIQSALQHWLGDIIQVDGVEVESDAATLTVFVRYTVHRTQETHTTQFVRERGTA